MKTEWYDRTIQGLQLNSKVERNQQAYARSIRMLSQFYDESPDLMTEQELQNYFLHRANLHRWSPNIIFLSIHRSNTPIDMDAAADLTFLNPAFGGKTTSKVGQMPIGYATFV